MSIGTCSSCRSGISVFIKTRISSLWSSADRTRGKIITGTKAKSFSTSLRAICSSKIQEDGKAVDVPIREGEMFLLPPGIPHNPIRGENTIGLVIERKRREGELDGLLWYCENCNEKLYEEYFQLEDITTQFQSVFKKFYGSEELRTCKSCGAVLMPPPVVA